MNIAIDIDGVIFDSLPGFLKLIKEDYPFCSLKKEQLKDHALEKVLGLPSETICTLYADSLKKYTPTLIGNAPEIINSLIESGDNIYIVTSRSPHELVLTYKHLKDAGINIRRSNNIIFTGYDYKKSDLIERLNLDIVIDDNIEEYIDYEDRNIDIIIYKQPWNDSFNLGDKLIFVRSWDEIYEFVSRKRLLEQNYSI